MVLQLAYFAIGGDYVIPTSKTSDMVVTIGIVTFYPPIGLVYVYPYGGSSFDF